MIIDSYDVPPSNEDLPSTSCGFESVAEFKSKLLDGTISFYSMRTIIRFFDRDSVGIPIMDIDNLYVPSLPDSLGFSDDFGFSWEDNDQYSSHSYDNENKKYIVLHIVSEEMFDVVKSDYNEEYYTKIVLEEGSKKSEAFYYYDTLAESYTLALFVTEGENRYIYFLSDLEEIPSNDIIFSMGITKYEG